MNSDELVGEGFWEPFLDTHHLSLDEEDAFLAYLTHPDAVLIRSLADLEHAYAHFQRTQHGEQDHGQPTTVV